MASDDTYSEAEDGSDEAGLGSTVLFFIVLTAFLIILCLFIGLKYAVCKSKTGVLVRKCCRHLYSDCLCHERGIDISHETPPPIPVCNDEAHARNSVYQPTTAENNSLFSDSASFYKTPPIFDKPWAFLST